MKPLAITLGDPAGIGAEVVLKALASLDVPVWLFGDRNYASQAGAIPESMHFVDVGGSYGKVQWGTIDAEYGRIALESIYAGIDAVERGDCSALVTAPIHKQAIAAAGSPHPGHTEILAARAGLTKYGRDFAMCFDSPQLRTVLLSVHVSLREAIAAVTSEAVADLAELTDREYARLHGTKPRIAVAGVNPHAGEGGRFGDEETAIARGVSAARATGVDATGPHPPDTVFLAAAQGRYDVVMAMYHDQGLIPVKTLAFEQSVNVTLGLPYLRVSVDHGTAFDIAGQNRADAGPMRYAIEWTARQVERR